MEITKRIKEFQESLEERDITLVHTGGKTLNYFLETNRLSDDQDYVYSFASNTSSRTMFKKIVDTLEKIYSVKINNVLAGCGNTNDKECRKDNEERFKKNKESFFVEKSGERINSAKIPNEREGLQINTVHLYLKGDRYLLDFTHDEIPTDENFYTKIENVNIVKLEYTLAAKTTIMFKRINDYERFINNKYFRHIYDIYRILSDKKFVVDKLVYDKASEIIIAKDKNNTNLKHRLNKIIEGETTRLLDRRLELDPNNPGFTFFENIILDIEETYDVLLDKYHFKRTIIDWIESEETKYK